MPASPRTQALITAALRAAFTLPAAAQTPQRIRGTVKALEGNTLVVDTREGDTARIVLAPNYTVAAVVPVQYYGGGYGRWHHWHHRHYWHRWHRGY